MEAADLMVILTDDDALRLAIAWPRVGAVPGLTETELVRAWSRASGVSLFATRRLAPVLIGAKVCLDGGGLDQRAEIVARNRVALALADLEDEVRRRRPPDGAGPTPTSSRP